MSSSSWFNASIGEILSISTSNVFTSVEIGLKEDPWFLINADSNDISVIIDKKYIIVGKTELNITNEILNLLDEKVKKISLD